MFRLALDRRPASVRARLRPGVTRASVELCADRPVNSLFRDGANLAVVRPDFESESYFGAGWSGVERTATGRARYGSSGAVFLLPLQASYSYRLSLDLATARPTTIDMSANDVAVGTCEVPDRVPCEFALPPASVRAGLNVLKLSVRSSQGDGDILTFRGARVSRGPM